MGARRYPQACYARDLPVGEVRQYHKDIPAAEIDRRHAAAFKAIRARRSAVDATSASRGLGSWPAMEAQLPRGWK
jgi:hypothetical protein